MNPLVSIIIPVYNGGNYLAEAIESALAQTYPCIEVIVVNDGSSDGGLTEKIALAYGDRIRYFKKENGGVASALNLGIREMKGEYFSWLSHDDLYLPDKIACDIEVIKSSGDMTTPVHGGWATFNMENGICNDRLSEISKLDISYYESGILSILMGLVDGCSLLIHQSYFDKHGLFNEKLLTTQDYAKWFEMFRQKKMGYVDKVLVKNRIHKLQTTNTNENTKKNREELHVWFAEQLNENDVLSTDMDYYTLLCVAMTRFENTGVFKAAKVIESKLRKVQEPEYGEESRKKLKEFLGNNSIYLYCMGNRGRSLLRAFKLRGVEVDGFADQNSKICSQIMCGVRGVPLRDVPKDSLVIVTKEDADKLAFEIKEIGFDKVLTYTEIEQLVMETTIDKRKLNGEC